MGKTIRIRLIAIALVIVFCVMAVRLYSLQIIKGESYKSQADRQYVSAPINTFDRGTIYLKSKDGTEVSGATLSSGYYLAMVPKDIVEPEDLYNLLSPIVNLKEDDFLKKAGKKDDPFEEIIHNISVEQAGKISALKESALRLYKEKWRFYPFNSLGAQSIGFVAYEKDKLTGRYGLERTYESLLSRDMDSTKVNFFADVFLNLKENIFDNSAKGDLVTSLEPAVQGYLEKTLASIHTKYQSKTTGGIIINPQNGEIYSLGSVPNFDLNQFSKVSDSSVYINPLVERVYEMGSVIKPLTMSAGIDSGAITEQSRYNDTGSVTYNGKKISNHDKIARGDSSMQDILNHSLNVGASWIMEKMGTENFSKYFLSFGIDKKTGIDLPNETSGLVSNLKSNRLIEHATASYGQGIAMSPIATVRALSTLANGGKLITPHIGTEMKLRSGITKKIEYPEPIQVLKKESTDIVTKMLIEAVDTSLQSGKVKLDNYTIAAKTGTAQIADNSSGGYYEDKFLHSFFGYFPARNPQFLVFLYMVEPKGVQYASDTLTNSFMDITKFLLHYYEVAPDRNI